MRPGVRSLAIAAALACLSCPLAWGDTSKVTLAGDALSEELASVISDALPEEDAPVSAFQARRQADRAADIALRVLNSRAYFAADVTARAINTNPLSAELMIEPGPQFTLSSVSIRYTEPQAGQPSQNEILADIDIAPGDIAFPKAINAAQKDITALLREKGYAFADTPRREAIGDRSAGTLEVIYVITPGPKVALGNVKYPDGIRTKPTWLGRLEGFNPGEIYTPSALSQFNSRLASTRLFDLASASLADTPRETLPDGREVYDVITTLDERKRNTIATGVSLSTDRGLGATIELERRNFSRRGDSISADLTIAQLERALGLKWDRPHEFGFGRNLTFGAAFAEEETDAFDSLTLDLRAGVEVERTPQVNFAFGLEAAQVRETVRLSQRTADAADRDITLANVYVAGQRDQSDSRLDPKRGWRADLRLEPTAAFGDSDANFLRTVGQVRGYLPFGQAERTVLAGRLRLGSAFGASLSDLPSDRRYYSGGGGSVRGFAFQAIGPRTDDGEPLGGRSLAEASLELRWAAWGRVGLVGFVDAGSVSQSELGFEDVRTGAGFGVRYQTAAGPIRADIAVPVDRSDFDDPVQIYLSIGQAF
ncbi:MAG: autotransporter assembly complex family protein [Pseudomonadota bacterium]